MPRFGYESKRALPLMDAVMQSLEFRFTSRAIAWCRYFPDSLELEICFTNGASYRYLKVPRFVLDGLITASSAGRYYNSSIARQFYFTRLVAPLDPPIQSRGTAGDLLDRSLASIAPHLPNGWIEPIQGLLANTPILVRVVRRRKSKHGDHRVSVSKGFSSITVNDSGNPWQFVLTLLHEIAHAHVAHSGALRVTPHGVQWKQAFSDLLRSHLYLFPSDLNLALSDYARDPLYSSDSHPSLAKALQKHDTLDVRGTVEELAPGQMFSLDGKTVMVKCHLLRKRYLCRSTDGRAYHVSPTARVEVIYDSLAES